jgi:hypothetical protein
LPSSPWPRPGTAKHLDREPDRDLTDIPRVRVLPRACPETFTSPLIALIFAF